MSAAELGSTIVLSIGSSVYLFMAWLVVRNRSAPGARPTALALAACFAWMIGSIVGKAASDLTTFSVAIGVMYLGAALVAPATVLLVSHLVLGRQLSDRAFGWLLVIPILTVVATWTNPWHELMWSHPPVASDGAFQFRPTWGPWYVWVYGPYSYGLGIVAMFWLIRAMIRGNGDGRGGAATRMQVGMLIVAMSLPLLASLSHTIGMFDDASNPTPIALTVSGAIFGWTFFRLEIYRVDPVLHHQVFMNLADGFVVSDHRSRLVDVNPPAVRFLGNEVRFGTPIDRVFERYPLIAAGLAGSDESFFEVDDHGGRTHEIRITSIVAGTRRRGRTVQIRDISDRKQAEAGARQNEILLGSIVANSPNGILRLRPVDPTAAPNGDFDCTFANQAACRYLEVSSEELVGSRVRDRMPVLAPALLLLFGYVLAHGATEGIEVSTSGGALWFRVIATAVEGEVLVTFVDITDQKHRQIELARVAATDPLTGLFNRRGLEQAWSHGFRGEAAAAPATLLYFDLDGFKGINDLHGHAVGDKLLHQFAERLRAGIRDRDLLARVGGDEFVAVLLGADRATSEEVAGRLLEALAAPYWLGGGPVRCAPSVGMAGRGTDGTTLEEVLAAADRAMYQAKAGGGGLRLAS